MADLEEPTNILGFWLDPQLEFSYKGRRSEPSTIRHAVGVLKAEVLKNVNKVYAFNPPLESGDMKSKIINDAKLDDDVHGIRDKNGLVVLFSPKPKKRERVIERFETFKRTERKVTKLIDLMDDSHSDFEDEGPVSDPNESNTEIVEGGGIDQLVNIFHGMREDMCEQKAEFSQLNRWLRQEREERKVESASHKEELRQEQEERKAEVAGLYRWLRQEREERKAEVAGLNRSLRQEQEERKADSASHKEETSRLNRLLLLEEEERKYENQELMAETKRLKETITKEREERKAVVADLEGTIEQLEETIELQDAGLEECKRKLRDAKEQHDNDMRDLSELTQKLVPIHLRILLEYSRQKIYDSVGYQSWEDLRKGKNFDQLIDMILEGLRNAKDVHCLSRETVKYLCAFNHIRKTQGNHMAHNADMIDIRTAVEMEEKSCDVVQLKELFKFVYPDAEPI